MQRLTVALCFCAAACSQGGEAGRSVTGEMVQCAIDKAVNFAPVCTLERARHQATEVLVVRHPDGGFRRLSVLPDGKGLASADGADLAAQQLSGDLLEVRVGPDRYRFPSVARAPDATR